MSQAFYIWMIGLCLSGILFGIYATNLNNEDITVRGYNTIIVDSFKMYALTILTGIAVIGVWHMERRMDYIEDCISILVEESKMTANFRTTVQHMYDYHVQEKKNLDQPKPKVSTNPGSEFYFQVPSYTQNGETKYLY